MTQLVTVQTDFRDLEQMAEGLVGRVHATHVILPAGQSVDEGEWAQFAIELNDGSQGLAGVGRCVTVVDNGDERAEHQRFDVVFDSLQFDDHDQRVFEHILALHGTGEAPIEEVMDAESVHPASSEDTGGFDVSTDFTGPAQVGLQARADNDDLPEHTMVASDDELEAALSDPSSVRPAPGAVVNDVAPQHQVISYGGGSAAIAMHAAIAEDPLDEPLSGERIAPRPVNGVTFSYSDGIPFPAKPPRPQLDASLKVTPAPRPAGTGH